MRYAFTVDGRTHNVLVEEHADGPRFVVDGETFQPAVVRTEAGHYEVTLDGTSFTFVLESGRIQLGPHPLDVAIQRARPVLQRAGGKGRRGDGQVKPPMPGKVVEVHVKEGDAISEGDPLLVLEAMKMQNDLKSPVSGIVTKVNVADGQNVEATTVMVVIEPEAE